MGGACERAYAIDGGIWYSVFLMVAVVMRWWLMADEDEDGGKVDGDGGMKMAADVMAADKDGGDVVFG
nr:hypothetical protein [Tanacetum cinerariifolium]